MEYDLSTLIYLQHAFVFVFMDARLEALRGLQGSHGVAEFEERRDFMYWTGGFSDMTLAHVFWEG